eukprot:COSAG01_NODE_1453_length_10258_cov_38.080126_12_plen_52_part_01
MPLRVSGWQEGQHVRCHVRVVGRPSLSNASRVQRHVSSIAQLVNLAGQLTAQ